MKFMSQLNPGAVKTFNLPLESDLLLPLYMREGTVRGMVMKASLVTKPLGPVKKICQAAHKNTGEANWLREEDGNYMLDAWIPPPQQESNKTSFHRRP